jgi:hypothetical protein
MSASREETELFVWYDKQVEAIEARGSPLWELERGELEKALLRRLEILRERQQLGAEPTNHSNLTWPLLPPPPPKKGDRYGKEYVGAAVEEVVRLASAEQAQGKRLGRTMRNKLAAQVDGVTAYAVDMIFRLMGRDLLADAGHKGWLKVADVVSATPSFINLHELETRS